MVEFAIIALLFFSVLFGVIEFGRMAFTLNTLTEMTRRGARVAAVCPPTAPQVVQQTLFNNAATSSATTSGILPFIQSSNVKVRYLDQNGAVLTTFNSFVTPGTQSTEFNKIKYVDVKIINYTHHFIFPPMNIVVGGSNIDSDGDRVFAETVLPRENLGIVVVHPDTGQTSAASCCFPCSPAASCPVTYSN